eukprot:CAMPEP_0113935376 /NCGR_PEP_ID=MMETSP1339-20121228/2531_1 /TAXON_ID=94617 /ORGANISM="Fibrocapsa japonica" /LENGTH=425 /DNA_ID=CAMNT_0000937505 /DNA_START=84 /DNA_END=1361 /DNA_ORIENTATION=- /assembly_acc=CAM_ASM_000762
MAEVETNPFLMVFWNVILLDFPYAWEIGLFAYCLFVGIKMHHHLKGELWLHSLVLYIFEAYGAHTLIPLVLGEPPEYFENDFVGFVGIASWFLTQHSPFNIVPKFFSFAPCEYAMSMMALIFLGNVLCQTVDVCNHHFEASPYYPTPMVAPIVLGVMSVTVDQFFPLDKGLEPISKCVPWNIQIGTFCAVFYQLAIWDDGPIGEAFELYVVGPTLNKETATWIVTVLFTITGLYEFKSGDKFKNPFAPVVNSVKASSLNEGLGVVMRVGFAITALTAFAYQQLPNEELQSGQTMASGDWLTTCTVLPALRPCNAHVLSLNSTGYLNIYQGSTLPKTGSGAKPAVWASDKSASTAKKAVGAGPFTTEMEGAYVAVKDNGTVVWENMKASAAKKFKYIDYKMVLGQGNIQVYGMNDAITTELLWTSS